MVPQGQGQEDEHCTVPEGDCSDVFLGEEKLTTVAPAKTAGLFGASSPELVHRDTDILGLSPRMLGHDQDG